MNNGKAAMVLVCAGLVLSLGCATALRAAEKGESDQKLPYFPVSAPVDEKPYAGYGEVFILDDATVIVAVRELITPDGGDAPVPGELLDRAFFDLDITGLSLVEHGNRVFLDRNGMQLQRRGLSANDVTASPFEGARRAPVKNGNTVLDSFSGDMKLRSDNRSGSLFVSVLDAETKRLFTVTLVGISRPGGADPDAAARDGDDEVQESTCDISGCRNGGSGSITCPGKGCKCVCIAGDPVCSCTATASVG